jgi:hypothetical protein
MSTGNDRHNPEPAIPDRMAARRHGDAGLPSKSERDAAFRHPWARAEDLVLASRVADETQRATAPKETRESGVLSITVVASYLLSCCVMQGSFRKRTTFWGGSLRV